MLNSHSMNRKHEHSLARRLTGAIARGLKVIFSLGLAVVMAVGAVLLPLAWDDDNADVAKSNSTAQWEPIYDFELNSDETTCLVRTRRSILIRDVNTGELVEATTSEDVAPSIATWIPHTQQVLIGFADGRLMRWEPERSSEREFESTPHPDAIRAILITDDGETAVTACSERICVWNLPDQTLLEQILFEDGQVTQITFSRDETRILAGFDNGFVRVFRLGDLGLVKQYRQEMHHVSQVRFVNEERQIVVGSLDGTAYVIDALTGEIVRHLPPGRLYVIDLKISPDQKFAARTDWSSEIHVYSLKTWNKVATLSGHEKPVSSLRFSQTEPVLYSASHDGTLRSWDLNSFTELEGLHATLPTQSTGLK